MAGLGDGAAGPDHSVDGAPAGNAAGAGHRDSAGASRRRPAARVSTARLLRAGSRSRRSSGGSGRSWSCAHWIRSTPASASRTGSARLIPGLLGPGDLTLDRVGPDAFDPTDLGSIVTIRWPVHVGSVSGAVRLWVPESVVQLWLASPAVTTADERHQPMDSRGRPSNEASGATTVPRGELPECWRALAGFVTMPQGLRRLRPGACCPYRNATDRLTAKPERAG